MKGFNASSKKLAPTSTTRLPRERNKVLADGSTQHP